MKITFLKLIFLCLGSLFFTTTFLFAQTKPDFSYKRPIHGIQNNTQTTWYKIELPVEVLSQLNERFSDIRVWSITPQDTLEAPYLLRKTAEKNQLTVIDFRLINNSYQGNTAFVTLENKTEEAINFIELEAEQKNFDWRVQLEGSQNQQEWFTILDDYRIVSYQTSYSSYTFSKLIFPSSKYKYYRIRINSKQNERPIIYDAKTFLNAHTTGSYQNYPIKKQSIEQDAKHKRTLIYLELEKPAPVSLIDIQIKNDFDFYRPIHIEYLQDSVQTEKGVYFNYIPFHTSTLSSFEKTTFYTSPSLVRSHFRIAIDNYDNENLAIGNIQVKGLLHELFVRISNSEKPESYFLMYGDENAAKPIYDIEQFESNIPKDITALSLGESEEIAHQPIHTQQPLFENSMWLWAIMLVIIVLLSVFTFKMMRAKK